MARKPKRKAVVAESSSNLEENPQNLNSEDEAKAQSEQRQRDFCKREVDRRIAAMKAICEAETDNVLSRLRLLRSYLSKEQLQSNAMQFFQENLPNVLAIRNEKYQVYELQWNHTGGFGNLFENQGNGLYGSASINHMSNLPTLGGLQFSVNSVKKNLSNAANLQISDFMLDEPYENTMLGRRDSIQTPGAASNRLSFGTTPKTSRVPKNGEMLLSVHGSPLGVYKEDNLAAIHESGDRGLEDTS